MLFRFVIWLFCPIFNSQGLFGLDQNLAACAAHSGNFIGVELGGFLYMGTVCYKGPWPLGGTGHLQQGPG